MTNLEIGESAPIFQGLNENGELVKFQDFRGKKLVVFFYPKDDTPGCTNEACSIRDHTKEIREEGFEILGISPDKHTKHKKFIDKYEFPYSLIADPDKTILKAYGVWGPKKFMGREYIGVHRTTFLIDAEGKISAILAKVKTKVHGEEILEAIHQMN